MRYTYVITKHAAKDIAKLTPAIRERVKTKLLYFIAQDDPFAYAKMLANNRYGTYRWRIGDYRVVFDIDDNKIIILQVQHRKDVYRL